MRALMLSVAGLAVLGLIALPGRADLLREGNADQAAEEIRDGSRRDHGGFPVLADHHRHRRDRHHHEQGERDPPDVADADRAADDDRDAGHGIVTAPAAVAKALQLRPSVVLTAHH